MTLSKLGRLEEAAHLLKEACLLVPQKVLMPSNLGHALFELGRIDEARVQLAKAEANLKKTILFSSSEKKTMAAGVEMLRQKLEGVGGVTAFTARGPDDAA